MTDLLSNISLMGSMVSVDDNNLLGLGESFDAGFGYGKEQTMYEYLREGRDLFTEVEAVSHGMCKDFNLV